MNVLEFVRFCPACIIWRASARCPSCPPTVRVRRPLPEYQRKRLAHLAAKYHVRWSTRTALVVNAARNLRALNQRRMNARCFGIGATA